MVLAFSALIRPEIKHSRANTRKGGRQKPGDETKSARRVRLHWKWLNRDPGGGNSANGTECDAGDVFGNRVARKKKSRPENKCRQNKRRRAIKNIHTKQNHGAVSREQSVQRNFRPMIYDCGRYQQ